MKCAGQSALYTGWTIDGHPLTHITAADVRNWPARLGPLDCECGRLVATLNVAGRLTVVSTEITY